MRSFVLAAVLSIGLASVGRTSPVTWEFEGTLEIRNIGGSVIADKEALADLLTDLGVVVGAPVHGLVRFDSSAADTRPEPSNALYLEAMVHSELTVGDYELRSDLFEGDPIYRANDILAGTFPQVPMSTFFTLQQLGDAIGLLSRFGILSLELSSHDPGFFASATSALPLDPPTLSTLDPFGFDPTSAFGYGSDLYAGVQTELGNVELRASISRLERSAEARGSVPEPGLVALLVPGLLALAALRRRSS